MKNYYIFLCLDNVPIIELLVNDKYKAITNYEKINWNLTKYIIINFKSYLERKFELLEKGKIKNKHQILTNQITYYQVNLNLIKQEDHDKISKKEQKIIELADYMFYKSSDEFLKYIKKQHFFSEKDISYFDQALFKLKEEQKIIESWKNICKEKNKSNA